MSDDELLALYNARSERAADETYRQFGGYIYTIAYNILGNEQDAEEIVNDTLARLWNHIPPAQPENFYAYTAAAARNLARNRYRQNTAQRRGGGETALILDELRDCPLSPDTVEHEIDRRMLADALNDFLGTLKPLHRKIFVQRYWYCQPVDAIAADLSVSKSRVTVALMRTRQKLRNYLEKEDLL